MDQFDLIVDEFKYWPFIVIIISLCGGYYQFITEWSGMCNLYSI